MGIRIYCLLILNKCLISLTIEREIFPSLYMQNKSVLITARDFQILKIYLVLWTELCPPKSHNVEALVPSVVILGDGTFEK